MGLVGAFLVDWVLLLVPALACGLLAVRLGVTHWLLLLSAAIGGGGALCLAVFWLYLIGDRLGRGFSLAVFLLSVLVLADACRHGFAGWRALRPLLPVTALYSAAAFFNAAFAYLHVSFASNSDVGPDRFIAGLPADNVLPYLFARQLQTGMRPLPKLLLRGWQSSDRPPLQTGYYLMQQSVLHSGHFDDYELLGILLQCLWIPGLWALLAAMGKPRRATALCLTAAVFNGFVFQNTVFTWPKLVAAAGMMIGAAFLCTRQSERMMTSRTAGALTGLVVGTAMMAHPGSAFAMIGVAGVVGLLWLVKRWRPAGWRPPTWRFLWPAAITSAVCYLPWSEWYEKRYQPPANALTELQFAGIDGPVPHKTTTQVIAAAYRKAGLHGAISDKIANFQRPFENFFNYPRWSLALIYHVLDGQHAKARLDAHDIVGTQFFYIGTIVGVGCLGLAVLYGRALWDLGRRLLRGRRTAGDGSGSGARVGVGAGTGRMRSLASSGLSQEYVLLGAVAIYWVAWCLLLFGPGATIAHQGTYFTEPVLIALGVIGLWTFSPRWATVLTLASAVFTLGLYEHFTPVTTAINRAWGYNPRDPFTNGPLGLKVVPTGGVNTDPATFGTTALLAVSVLLCAAALWWVGADRRAPGADSLVDGSAAAASDGRPGASGATGPELTVITIERPDAPDASPTATAPAPSAL